MPLYEYQCKECGRRTEKIQKFSDPELTTCPHCGGVLERTLTAPAVQFKGGGWYKDLYSSAKPAAASGEGAKGTGSGESAPAKTEGAGSTASSKAGDSGGGSGSASTTTATAPAASTASKS